MASLNFKKRNFSTKTSKSEKPEVSNEEKLNEEVTKISNNLKEKYQETKLNSSLLHVILKECMELVENFNCPGSEKKKHALVILKSLINELVENKDEQSFLLKVIDDNILENTVDLIIQASKGQLNLNNNENKKVVVGCVSLLLNLGTLIGNRLTKKKK